MPSRSDELEALEADVAAKANIITGAFPALAPGRQPPPEDIDESTARFHLKLAILRKLCDAKKGAEPTTGPAPPTTSPNGDSTASV